MTTCHTLLFDVDTRFQKPTLKESIVACWQFNLMYVAFTGYFAQIKFVCNGIVISVALYSSCVPSCSVYHIYYIIFKQKLKPGKATDGSFINIH